MATIDAAPALGGKAKRAEARRVRKSESDAHKRLTSKGATIAR